MALFSSTRLYSASPALIPQAAADLADSFRAEGFEVDLQPLLGGGADLSLRKGGMFKAVLGMKTALKVLITPRGDKILAEASVGIFGQQVVPGVIALFFLWPVLLTQIWGLVEQAKLDDRVLQSLGEALAHRAGASPAATPAPASPHAGSSPADRPAFCTGCGQALLPTARFCSACGESAQNR